MSKYLLFIFIILVVSCSKSKNTKNEETPIFTLLKSEKTNIHFNNRVREDYNNFFGVFNYAYNGAGVAIGDINNDGLSDIYFVGNQAQDKLYLNKGDFIFEDITRKSGIKPKKAWHNGVVMVDVNNDDLLDIYVTVGGWKGAKKNRANVLYINQGDATFKEQAVEYGLADTGFSIMASFFDADGDQDLDVYLTNRPKDFFLNAEQVLKGKELSPDYSSDKLYLNENGKYVDASKTNGIINTFGYGLGLSTSDLDKDGHVDIYVGNDFFENDYYFKNNGKGIFTENIKNFSNHTSYYTMGVDVVDINNDGLEDLFALDMFPEDYVRAKTTMAPMNAELYNSLMEQGFHRQYMHNVLNINNGNGFFSDISQLVGVNSTDWSWSCLGADFDNDGDNDFYVTNGYRRDLWDRDANTKRQEYTSKPMDKSKSPNQIIKEIVELYPAVKLQNYLFENKGKLKFNSTAKKWGLHKTSFSNGAAYGDLDNDGDLDLVVNNIDDEAFIYRNNSQTSSNNYLNIKFNGPSTNTKGLGNKITIFHNDSIQYKEFKTVRGYLSSVDPKIHFGLGELKKIDSIKIIWPDGKQNILQNIDSNQTLNISYASAKKTASKKTEAHTLLTETTSILFKEPFTHKENIYDDFKDQVLIPHKLSQNGPCITVSDINNDGLEDFYIGGAGNQSGQIYLQNSKGKFTITNQPVFKSDLKYEDVGATFFDADGDLDLDLYVVSGGNEFEVHSPTLQDRLYLNDGKGNFSKSNNLPQLNESGSVVIPLDFDADGDLDLFVGGRLIPKTYPYAPKSFLLENDKGIFKDVTNTIAPKLSNIGMVTSAVWSDIDGNKTNELILVGEWMPITIFELENKTFKNVTAAYGLEHTNGWWNKIIASDIDNDGDNDFVVGNLGLNYKFKAIKEKPFTVYANDFDNNGTNDIFLAKYYQNRQVPIRGKECSSQQLPGLKKKFKTYKEFAKADIFQIIDTKNNQALKYEAKEFASIILRNVNGKLSLEILPIEAQFSTINGIVVDDFNKDGIKDILIAGNKFEVEVETTRADASIGLLMLGTKTGTYKTINSLESGYFMPYNAKDLQYIEMGTNTKAIITAINNSTLQIHTYK
ncbi:VCBS repeat-containing protein [uncultured Aquimarina sp.]|uniref:VCBS repeat-containing protein n=1 Tax=uncultured Aquimarina sp. TaxID=575652 RepID=UPI0026395415|nr:VCBS repeat-containing protein [uncultured Aquimarina sp.]